MSDARHEHLTPEALTELAASAGDERLAAARRAALACSACATELGELERFLVRSRAALERATPVGAAERADLAARILAATTRFEAADAADASLAEVLPFGAELAASLRGSRLLRLAAASLVAHLLALPVLAWYLLERQDRPAIWVTIAPPTEAVEWAEPDLERLPPLSVPALDSGFDETLLVSADPEPVRIENSIRLARFDLGRGGPEVEATGPSDETPLEGLLRARARLVASYSGDRSSHQGRGPLELSSELLADDATALERALAAEIRLDAYVLGGHEEGLAAALGRLYDTDGTAPEVRRLEAAALARAEAYGLLDEVQRGRLAAARRDASLASDRLALELVGAGADANARRVPPLGSAWIAALGAALPPEVRERAVARAWLAHVR